MTRGTSSPPDFAAFLQGREPLFVSRIEHHGHGGFHGTRCPGGGSVAHPYAVVVLLTTGHSRTRQSGALQLRPGDVHLIPPGDAHASSRFEQATGWTLAFWPEQSGHSPRLFSQVRGGCHPVLRPTPEQRRRLEERLQALEDEFAGHDEHREEALAAHLQLVLVELVRASASTLRSGTEASSLARQVLAFVERSALQPLSLSDVARAVARTPAHVATVVRRETGRTVGEWILSQRMAEARRRLRGTDSSMDDIARQVGYADVTHFIRQFRRVHGQTPAQWRRTGST